MPIQKYVDECLSSELLTDFAGQLRVEIDNFFAGRPHGRAEEWSRILETLPEVSADGFSLSQDTVQLDLAADDALKEKLQAFKPWRKGPFQLGDIFIDTEWRSDWKWQRIQPHIQSLQGRDVLDIGCGNGYHLLRMLGHGAKNAAPTLLGCFFTSFISSGIFTSVERLDLPLPEHLPKFKLFDTVFSLGVLYHRRSPIDHLTELLSFFKPEAELVLETLVVEGDQNTVLVPEDRYAKMANVWFTQHWRTGKLVGERALSRFEPSISIRPASRNSERPSGWTSTF